MLKKVVVAFILSTWTILIIGCATAKPITGPDGSQHQLITCESIEYCYEKATEVCGGKYQMVNNSTEHNSIAMANSSPIITSQFKLLVKCEGTN